MAEEKKDSKSKRPTAEKRDMQNAKQRLRNRSFKSRVHTAVRSFEKELQTKDLQAAKTRLQFIYSLLDKGVKKRIFALNKASRLKAKFASKISV